MTLIRPDLLADMTRAREVILGGAVALAGGWMVWLGGYVLVPLGLAVVGSGIGWALVALRRLRFDQGGDAPGLVEIVEGQIGYLGPGSGGFVSLAELTELRLITLRGRRVWRLKQADGQALLVPVDAAGAGALFDAFASLPGMDSGALVAALQPPLPQGGRALRPAAETQTVWRRSGRGVTVS